jgi:hypothetical protein
MAQARLGSDCVKTAAALAAKRPWGGPHWVKSGKARSEHIPSGLPPGADIVDAFWQVRFVQEQTVKFGARDCRPARHEG